VLVRHKKHPKKLKTKLRLLTVKCGSAKHQITFSGTILVYGVHDFSYFLTCQHADTIEDHATLQ